MPLRFQKDIKLLHTQLMSGAFLTILLNIFNLIIQQFFSEIKHLDSGRLFVDMQSMEVNMLRTTTSIHQD